MKLPEGMRILTPAKGVYAYYDGRLPGYHFAETPNWVDEGALTLGIASYALVAGHQAIVYDTHVTVDHARAIRRHLERLGVTDFTVVLSHRHLDHVAGTEAFADCRVITNALTAAHLERDRAAIEAGTLGGLPAIAPLVLPTETFEGQMALTLGGERIELIQLNIHSDDATVLWLPERRILLAGDTLEDTVTYVGEPEGFDAHLRDLARLSALGPLHILPNHGDPDVIAKGGFGSGLIGATERYVALLRSGRAPESLAEAMPLFDTGKACRYAACYEAVHRENLARVAELAQ
ncbi:MBL fold metallo-hydrolase [Seohaeicola nanhaiensis]|uniref:MBL fold metallo-hydrolase n=1 Tax=Seohaeicola nanhaiensis TaxID=1387282 RepID=A0ABV9KEE4_9RHOB